MFQIGDTVIVFLFKQRYQGTIMGISDWPTVLQNASTLQGTCYYVQFQDNKFYPSWMGGEDLFRVIPAEEIHSPDCKDPCHYEE